MSMSCLPLTLMPSNSLSTRMGNGLQDDDVVNWDAAIIPLHLNYIELRNTLHDEIRSDILAHAGYIREDSPMPFDDDLTSMDSTSVPGASSGRDGHDCPPPPYSPVHCPRLARNPFQILSPLNPFSTQFRGDCLPLDTFDKLYDSMWPLSGTDEGFLSLPACMAAHRHDDEDFPSLPCQPCPCLHAARWGV
ncbi:hypothetical protein D9619_009598 [Psilocybe cf. subviscida]|uniref:Uncharacterized protein n=1 Tax=Psilocybe cf. subviscida TaxID=2480587 RepID=A0A8H5BMU4_9AGAR|nr:hypothetical protein D9619_009598 [Psilocybe cf. subviscida]